VTLEHARTSVGLHPTPPVDKPRLRLKPKASQSGYVDGGQGIPHTDNCRAVALGIRRMSRLSPPFMRDALDGLVQRVSVAETEAR